MEKADKDLSELVSDYAIENYKHGLNCSESVYEALVRAGVLNVDKNTVGMCTGFGGGIGLYGATCGALSAAIMANSAVYGRKDPYAVDAAVRGSEIAEKYYRRFNNIVKEFVERNGCTSCEGITSKYEDWEGKERRIYCLKMIGATAQLAYKYLQIPQEEAFKLPYDKNMRNMK
ncbi:MAG: C_GCAxxG_C_C family protein [Negativicutes bacterium]|nr:C_GCAxxG_C_C family protein [Negativicutes bacterium]